MRREHNERAWHAWHTAALYRMKKMPKLDSLLQKERKPKPRQTWQEQLEIARMWHEALKGKNIRERK